jgi:hypothetical protein
MSTVALALLSLLTLCSIGGGFLLHRLGAMLATWPNPWGTPPTSTVAITPPNSQPECAEGLEAVAKRQMDNNATTYGTH